MSGHGEAGSRIGGDGLTSPEGSDDKVGRHVLATDGLSEEEVPVMFFQQDSPLRMQVLPDSQRSLFPAGGSPRSVSGRARWIIIRRIRDGSRRPRTGRLAEAGTAQGVVPVLSVRTGCVEVSGSHANRRGLGEVASAWNRFKPTLDCGLALAALVPRARVGQLTPDGWARKFRWSRYRLRLRFRCLGRPGSPDCLGSGGCHRAEAVRPGIVGSDYAPDNPGSLRRRPLNGHPDSRFRGSDPTALSRPRNPGAAGHESPGGCTGHRP